MKFSEVDYVAPVSELVGGFAHLLPDYLPGKETGPATVTDLRSCWIKSAKGTLEALAHRYDIRSQIDIAHDAEGRKQIKAQWTKGDGLKLAVLSGWGSRDDLENSFQQLERIKAPQKIIIYSCARWHEAVLDQLSAALLRYPHHIEGEWYISVNLLGNESKVVSHAVQIRRSGELTLPEVLLLPVAGSPFSWAAQVSTAGQR